jgi:hypothetical protein
MSEGGLMNVKNSLYVEFGAGKAGLSSFVAADLHERKVDTKESGFLIIEREARRGKLDRKIRDCGFRTVRERMDIADFDLVKWL